jgi:hypothetical protein
MKRPGGVTAIAIYYLVTGVLALLGFCTLVGLPTFGLMGDVFSDAGLFALATAGLCVALFMLFDAVLSLVAAVGMLKMREWGRFLGIFLALFSLLAFPVGTIIGIAILWYLFQGEVKEAFALESDPYRADYTIDADSTPADEKDFQYYPPNEESSDMEKPESTDAGNPIPPTSPPIADSDEDVSTQG